MTEDTSLESSAFGEQEIHSVRYVIRLRLSLHTTSLRKIMAETGVSHSTVARFIEGKDIWVSNYMALRAWAASPSTGAFPAPKLTPEDVTN